MFMSARLCRTDARTHECLSAPRGSESGSDVSFWDGVRESTDCSRLNYEYLYLNKYIGTVIIGIVIYKFIVFYVGRARACIQRLWCMYDVALPVIQYNCLCLRADF